ncbi:MAG TPA: YciI family protein [Candidatus Cybelea sp.]
MPYFVLIRERATAWNWNVPMRRQAEWAAHAVFMDQLAQDGFIVAGGPLGGEDHARRVMHVVIAPDADAVEEQMAADPWTPMGMAADGEHRAVDRIAWKTRSRVTQPRECRKRRAAAEVVGWFTRLGWLQAPSSP